MSVLVRHEVPEQRAAPAIEALPSWAEHARTKATAAGLLIVATGTWPDGVEAEAVPPGVAGFIVSSFNPLAVEVARRALSAYAGSASTAVTAVILVSADGDVTSARSVAHAVDDGGRVGPLMFFQSVPNAVAGYVAAQWGLTGPVVAISPVDDALAEGFDVAGLLLADGDADRALLIFVDLAQEMNQGEGKDIEHDRALALLVERRSLERPKELDQ